MSEYLFRGKRTNNGEWVYGYLCTSTNYIGDTNSKLSIQEGGYFRHVDPATAGQYIEKTDKNNNKVFDGDFIRDDKGRLFKIVWGCDLLWLAKTNETHGSCYCPKRLIEKGAIRVGDIHSNPELEAEWRAFK